MSPGSCEPARVRLSWCRLYLYHQPPPPSRTSSHGEASPLRLLVPCVLPRVLSLCILCACPCAPACVSSAAASAVARACALGRLIDIGKRLHSASRTAAKTYNRRPEAATKSATSSRRRGRLYYIMLSSMPQRVPPCQPCSACEGSRSKRTKSPGERLPVGVLSWGLVVSSVRSCWRREAVALHALICRLPEVSR